jgi:putative membrane protein
MNGSALLTTLAFAVAATATAAASLSSNDVSFVQSAEHDAMGNYALAALARGRAQTPTVKDLAKEILSNASSATDFIRRYASTHGVKTDNKPGLRADSQYAEISSDTGTAFDRAFARDIRIDASIAKDTYEREAQHGSDRVLRRFARQQLDAMQKFAAAAQKAAS